MKVLAVIFASIATLTFVSPAFGEVPSFNATCPAGIEVHADQGGPIYINGKEARLTSSNSNYYEAHGNGVVISLSINPDGTPAVSYTGKHRANGICQLTDGGGGRDSGGCPADVSQADRYKFPACN